KNWESHKVSLREAEQVFFNRPLIVADDVKHSGTERRYFVLGQTDDNRPLFVAFTLRGDSIRVISARDMSRRERKVYQG
ncbi:MAG: BrnT family toxin, partial [Spirochaetales bacterium]